MWQKIGPSHYNNCTDFAFHDYVDLVFVNDLDTLIRTAIRLGWRETSNLDEATVILFGSGYEYSHAIRKVNGNWEEIYGNDHNRWTGSDHPVMHHGDRIVAVLAAP